jgi:hypothetical protein
MLYLAGKLDFTFGRPGFFFFFLGMIGPPLV